MSFISRNINTPLKKTIAVLAIGAGTGYIIFRGRLVWMAKKYVGITEIAGNKGWANTQFQEMLSSIGWKSGEAWCMYFVKAVYDIVFDSHKMNKILTPSVFLTYNNALDDKTCTVKVIREDKPRKGDIAIWYKYDSSGGYVGGHAGIVIKTTSERYGKYGFTTVEGNTNEQGSRNGDSILVKDREYNWHNKSFQFKGFIRKRALPICF